MQTILAALKEIVFFFLRVLGFIVAKSLKLMGEILTSIGADLEKKLK